MTEEIKPDYTWKPKTTVSKDESAAVVFLLAGEVKFGTTLPRDAMPLEWLKDGTSGDEPIIRWKKLMES